jgi:hypothetical protein
LSDLSFFMTARMLMPVWFYSHPRMAENRGAFLARSRENVTINSWVTGDEVLILAVGR